ncbi:sugar-transfer associated ATP-grasp domain-containing protein [Myroides odoratus]
MKLVKVKGFLAYLKRALFQLKKIKNWKGIHLIFFGFTPNKIYLYDFKKYNKNLYLTDFWRYVNTHEINSKYSNLFNDKLSSYFFLKNYSSNIVPVCGIIDKGKYNVIDQTNLSEGQLVILKDKNGWGGFGVRKGILKKGELYDLKDIKFNLNELSNFIVVPLLKNASYASKIYPNTLNTIRILSGIIDGEVSNIRAIHRFGQDSTGVVDNFSNGGLSCNIDLNSGTIDSVVYLNHGHKIVNSTHPTTNEKLLGLVIPDWNHVLRTVNDIHKEIKYVKYIGWDVAICETGIFIIEANHISDIDLIQTHLPLKINLVNKVFFEDNF